MKLLAFAALILLSAAGQSQTAIGYLTHRRVSALHIWARSETEARKLLDGVIDDPNVLPYLDTWFATQAPTKGPAFKDPTPEEFAAVEDSRPLVDLSRIPALFKAPDTTLGSPAPEGGPKSQFHYFLVKDASYAVRVQVTSTSPRLAAVQAYNAVQNQFIAPLFKVGRLDYVKYNLTRGIDVHPLPELSVKREMEAALGPIPWGKLLPVNAGDWITYVTLTPPSYGAPFDVSVEG